MRGGLEWSDGSASDKVGGALTCLSGQREIRHSPFKNYFMSGIDITQRVTISPYKSSQ